MPMPQAAAAAGSAMVAASPRTAISPASGATTPAAIFIRVDLPAPFWPSRPRIWPGSMARSTPSQAVTRP